MGLGLEENHPIKRDVWSQFLSNDDLDLCSNRLSRQLLHISRHAIRWQYSDEVLFAADCSNPHEVSARLEQILNRVVTQVTPDPGERVMIAVEPHFLVVKTALRIKFIIVPLSLNSLLRALVFGTASNRLQKTVQFQSQEFD